MVNNYLYEPEPPSELKNTLNDLEDIFRDGGSLDQRIKLLLNRQLLNRLHFLEFLWRDITSGDIKRFLSANVKDRKGELRDVLFQISGEIKILHSLKRMERFASYFVSQIGRGYMILMEAIEDFQDALLNPRKTPTVDTAKVAFIKLRTDGLIELSNAVQKAGVHNRETIMLTTTIGDYGAELEAAA